MRPGTGAAKTVAGLLAVVGMLALSSPGVRVARAGDGDAATLEFSPVAVPAGETAGVCKVGDEPRPRANRSAISAEAAERIRLEMQSSGEKPVVLNSHGYNYRTVQDPLRELQVVEAEATRQQEAAPPGP
jgi:hypothetical protein